MFLYLPFLPPEFYSVCLFEQALLDDQIVKTQSMRASPYIKALEAQAAAWEVLMVTLQEIVDNWLTCQGTWQYLEPIFSSPDILKQMPEEGEKFQVVDQAWRDVSGTGPDKSDMGGAGR